MRRSWQSWWFALLAVVIAVCVAALSARFGITADWSAGARATLALRDRAVLKELPGPIDAVAYTRPGALRAKTRLLIERYQRFKPDLILKFVDPDLDPIATQDAGISADGEIVLHWHGRSQPVTPLGEGAFSDALVRLARGRTQLVAFVTGDGERDPAGTGAADLGRFTGILAARGVRSVPLNLAEAAEIPRNASLVVLASPQAALPPSAVHKLENYLGTGGNLLWLTEPGSDDLGLAPLAHALGVKRLPGMLLEASGGPGGGRDSRMVVATRYPAHTITAGFNINTRFPQTVALAALSDAPWNAQPILQSSARSWDEATPLDPAQVSQAVFDPAAGELKGPLNFGYALSRLSPSPAKTQQRVVVIGDGDFLSNAYLGDGGNRAFGERVVDWLLGDDALVAAVRPAPDTMLKPTRTELALITYGYLVAFPIILIGLGFWISRRRRHR